MERHLDRTERREAAAGGHLGDGAEGRAEAAGESAMVPPAPATPAPPQPSPLRAWAHTLWQSSWWRPMQHELHPAGRFVFSGVGAGSWTLARFDSVTVSVLEAISGLPGPLAVFIGVSAVATWFGVLLAWQERGCSPSRLFIEGMFFAAFTGSVIAAESPITQIMENIQ